MLEKNCKFSLKFEEKGRVRPDWTNIKRTICALSFRANRVNYIFTNEFMYSPNYLFLTITIYTPCQVYTGETPESSIGIQIFLDYDSSPFSYIIFAWILCSGYPSSFSTFWTNFTISQLCFSCSIYQNIPFSPCLSAFYATQIVTAFHDHPSAFSSVYFDLFS